MLAKWGVSLTRIGHIVELQKAITDAHGDKLEGGKMKFGRAQKLLNMYLKYMWCAGEISTPPHCPFDNQIINNGGLQGNDDPIWDELGGLEMFEKTPENANAWAWTKSDSIEHYLVWLAAAEKARRDGEYDSLSEWELVVFGEIMCRCGCFCGEGCY